MDLYTQVACDASRLLTNRYSSSFSLASKLFDAEDRQHIYNIYGLVRIADEVVDTYQGDDSLAELDALEADVKQALTTGYSSNVIVHAFVYSARALKIAESLISPFFESMRVDGSGQKSFTEQQYETYIYGSAEVVGLMCLRVFCIGDTARFEMLSPGARALGSFFQKVNFLRDIADDFEIRGRYYFPNSTFESFDDETKHAIIEDIKTESIVAFNALTELNTRQRRAVGAAYNSYMVLLQKLHTTPAADIKQSRVRISNVRKIWLAIRAFVGSYERAR